MVRVAALEPQGTVYYFQASFRSWFFFAPKLNQKITAWIDRCQMALESEIQDSEKINLQEINQSELFQFDLLYWNPSNESLPETVQKLMILENGG